MRSAGSKVPALVSLLLLLIASTPSYAHAAPAAGGVTIAPADIRLELAQGQHTATDSFTVTNHYTVPVTLQFAFTQSQQEADVQPPVQSLSLQHPAMVLAAEGSATQVITMQDSDTIQPGSVLADLVITQHMSATSGVGVSPAIRLPVSIIKDAGAVSSLGFAGVSGIHTALTIPKEVTVSLHNTGNMIAIPHGTVNIIAPNGTVVGKGTVNESSAAVLPGKTLHSNVVIMKLASATLPGAYKAEVAYGLGGDSKVSTVTKSFLFAAWWNVGLALVAIALLWLGAKYYQMVAALFVRKKPEPPVPPKRPRQLLIGRDIT